MSWQSSSSRGIGDRRDACPMVPVPLSRAHRPDQRFAACAERISRLTGSAVLPDGTRVMPAPGAQYALLTATSPPARAMGDQHERAAKDLFVRSLDARRARREREAAADEQDAPAAIASAASPALETDVKPSPPRLPRFIVGAGLGAEAFSSGHAQVGPDLAVAWYACPLVGVVARGTLRAATSPDVALGSVDTSAAGGALSIMARGSFGAKAGFDAGPLLHVMRFSFAGGAARPGFVAREAEALAIYGALEGRVWTAPKAPSTRASRSRSARRCGPRAPSARARPFTRSVACSSARKRSSVSRGDAAHSSPSSASHLSGMYVAISKSSNSSSSASTRPSLDVSRRSSHARLLSRALARHGPSSGAVRGPQRSARSISIAPNGSARTFASPPNVCATTHRPPSSRRTSSVCAIASITHT